MIVADENIDHSLIEAIRLAGIEVVSVYEEARGISDFSVIEIARNPPRIILTEDKDFGEWVFAHQVKDRSVVLIRYEFRETEVIKKIIIQMLSERVNELFGKFTTITTQKIRIRPL